MKFKYRLLILISALYVITLIGLIASTKEILKIFIHISIVFLIAIPLALLCIWAIIGKDLIDILNN